jgi:hypothetical protein
MVGSKSNQSDLNKIKGDFAIKDYITEPAKLEFYLLGKELKPVDGYLLSLLKEVLSILKSLLVLHKEQTAMITIYTPILDLVSKIPQTTIKVILN